MEGEIYSRKRGIQTGKCSECEKELADTNSQFTLDSCPTESSTTISHFTRNTGIFIQECNRVDKIVPNNKEVD